MKFTGIHERTDLRNKVGVFKDREHAGVPVGLAVADRLGLPFDVAVVSKITLPWDTEAGYGAVAFDGTFKLNKNLIERLSLSEGQIQQGIRKTRSKVMRRVDRFRGSRPFSELKGRTVILVDDGLASGFTMRTSVEALRNAGAENLIVAPPTAMIGRWRILPTWQSPSFARIFAKVAGLQWRRHISTGAM